MTEAAVRDERIMLLTADLGFKLFDDFAQRCPGRFLNMGVCEANMVGVAAGLALEGRRPFTYSIVPFATMRCLEHIRNDVCNMELPVVVTGVGGGFAYGINGATHHGVDDIGALRALPGMAVVCPADPREAAQAVPAILEYGRPVYLRLERAREATLPGTEAEFRFGCPKVLREGAETALLACGSVVAEALEAAEVLAEQGTAPLVLSVHTLKPIRELADMLRARDVRHVVTIEEHGPSGGLFEALCGHLSADPQRPRVTPLCAPDRFLHACGPQKSMRKMVGLDAERIVAVVSETRRNDR